MQTAHAIVSAVIAALLITGFIYGSWRRWMTRPGGLPAPRYQPRHHDSQHSGAERIPSRDELASWREDWTDTELRALRGDTPLPALPPLEWTLARWEREQESWLEARRREAHEQQLLLAARVWADPWWTR